MYYQRRLLLRFALALSAALVLPAWGQGAPYPSKPITVVVPFAAGSGTDIAARFFSNLLSQEIKQSVIVENRAGGTGTVAADYVAKAAPDGYTLLYLGGGSLSQTFFSRKLTTDILKDLAPVVQLARGEMFLIVRSDLPVKNVQEFLALVRKEPNKYNYASIAATQMMPMEVLKDKARVQMTHVPYKGAGQIQQAFEAGDVVAIVGNRNGYENLFDAKKVRYLMAFGNERNPNAPDVPSAAESGLPGVHAPYSFALWAPAGTPADVMGKLNAAFNGILKRPEAVEYIRRSGGVPAGGPPQVQADAIRAERAYWAEAARISKFVPE